MTNAPPRYQGHYDCIEGKTPTLLGLSGFGCSNWMLSQLAKKGLPWHCILPDNRGMGGTPHAEGPYEVDDLARDTMDLVEDLGLGHFAVLGVSMGGFIAESLYFMEPHRVRAMILMCTMGPGPEFVPLPEVSEQMIRESYRIDTELMVRNNLAKTINPEVQRENPELFEDILRNRLQNLADLEQLLLQYHAVNAFLKRPLPLEDIRCPVLVLHGAKDRYVDPENARILAERIPHARRVTIEEGDHLFFLEQPKKVSTIINHFLETL